MSFWDDVGIDAPEIVNDTLGMVGVSSGVNEQQAAKLADPTIAAANAAAQSEGEGNRAERWERTRNAGTSWERRPAFQESIVTAPDTHYDQRAYMYGRDPNAAQGAVDRAYGVGDFAFARGNQLLDQNMALAEEARNRSAPVGNFADQNAALGSSLGYGSQLAGLEATQGPSAAQAQLNQGTNQALNSQLALARSGRGFGGNAAAMGLAQGNVAGIQANNANQSAALIAQEDAAWRGRQAANYGNAAAISQGAGTQFGQQANTNLNAYLQNQGQNDAAALGYGAQGATAFGQGVAGSFAGQNLASSIRGQEMQGGQAEQDMLLRAWAARNGFNLQQQASADQQRAAAIQGAAALGGTLIGAFAGGPAGAAVGGTAGSAAGGALT